VPFWCKQLTTNRTVLAHLPHIFCTVTLRRLCEATLAAVTESQQVEVQNRTYHACTIQYATLYVTCEPTVTEVAV
jgi:hypothetical protein